MKRWGVLWGLLGLAAGASGAEDLEGVESPYSGHVAAWAKDPTVFAFEGSPETLALNCLANPDNPFYIAIVQKMSIRSSVFRVAAVLDDFAHYPDIFPSLKGAKVSARKDASHFTVSWEERIPIFFVPNVKYELNYAVADELPRAKTYRYRLKQTGDLKGSDGFIVVTAAADGSTNYIEADFWDAHWGILKAAGANGVWGKNVEGVALADLGLRLRAEHADWSPDRIKSEAKSQLRSVHVEECVKGRKAFHP